MNIYETTEYFAIDLYKSLSREEALAFQQTVAIGAELYQTKDILDTFLFFDAVLNYEFNDLIEYHDPHWYLKTVVNETIIPSDEEGIVCVCWKTEPEDISRWFHVIVKGHQAYKVDILDRLNNIGVL